MKNSIFLAFVALFMATAVNAQSTVDSIEAKYKLLPMPDSLTMEKMFPIVGSYQLNNPTGANAMNTTTTNTTSTNTADSSSSATTNTASSAGMLSVMMDSSNKGIVWISGLPQGKIKAYLKQSPATYRIIAQTTDAGTKVPEGTAMYDSTTKVLNIEIGTAYNDANPGAVFPMNNGTMMDSTSMNNMSNDHMNNSTTKTKTKSSKTKSKSKAKPKKVMYYTATKEGENMTSSTTTQQ